MQRANIHLPEAVVTEVREFHSQLGYGIDFRVEASSGNGRIYFEVVTYDNEARSYCSYIHEGDSVQVTGYLKAKPYQKKDGTAAISLVIERPDSIRKVFSGNRNPQVPQDSSNGRNNNPSREIDAVTATAVTDTAVTASAVTASAETVSAVTDSAGTAPAETARGKEFEPEFEPDDDLPF